MPFFPWEFRLDVLRFIVCKPYVDLLVAECDDLILIDMVQGTIRAEENVE